MTTSMDPTIGRYQHRAVRRFCRLFPGDQWDLPIGPKPITINEPDDILREIEKYRKRWKQVPDEVEIDSHGEPGRACWNRWGPSLDDLRHIDQWRDHPSKPPVQDKGHQQRLRERDAFYRKLSESGVNCIRLTGCRIGSGTKGQELLRLLKKLYPNVDWKSTRHYVWRSWNGIVIPIPAWIDRLDPFKRKPVK